MKTFRLAVLALTAVVCSSCLTTLLTVASMPTPAPAPAKPATVVVQQPATVVVTQPVSTTTTIRPPHGATKTTTVQVNAATTDLCLHLDLQAVAAAFAQSSSVEEFEMILNSSRYMISNLDLNRDGFVDYLRVMEMMSGYNHVFVIQAVLAYNVFQNIATLTVEPGYGSTYYCQIIGEPYIYGTAYIVQPVFVKTPPIFTSFGHYGYTVWTSPYHWDYFPTWYARPKPQYLSHYQAYVTTYITNHHYCHEVTYVNTVHYTNYETVRRSVSREDYRNQHPEQAFSTRTANITYTPEGSTSTRIVRNASDVRGAAQASTTSTTGTRKNASSSSQSAASSNRSAAASQSASAGSRTSTQSTNSSARSSAASQSASSSASSAKTQTATSAASRSTAQQSGTATATTSTRSTASSSKTAAATTTPQTAATTRSTAASSTVRSTTSTTSKVRESGRVTTTTRSSSAASSSRSASASSSSRSSSATSSSNASSSRSSNRSAAATRTSR
ncbi:MAG: hypothetical protein IJV55_07670 [Paludibacteraceae bacterium]|nr:hypothetical protein [Paludibacteraceae bacterium]